MTNTNFTNATNMYRELEKRGGGNNGKAKGIIDKAYWILDRENTAPEAVGWSFDSGISLESFDSRSVGSNASSSGDETNYRLDDLQGSFPKAASTLEEFGDKLEAINSLLINTSEEFQASFVEKHAPVLRDKVAKLTHTDAFSGITLHENCRPINAGKHGNNSWVSYIKEDSSKGMMFEI